MTIETTQIETIIVTDAPIQHKDIHAAMLGVMNDVGYVQKTGKFEGGKVKYNFAGEADFIAAIRPVMIRHGITWHPVAVSNYEHKVVYSKSYYNGVETEKCAYSATSVYTFRLTHAASGTHVDAVGVGEGNDPHDKASYKMATGALKYALRQSFIIETGNDPDDGKTPAEIAAEAKQQAEAEKYAASKNKADAAKAKAVAWVDNYIGLLNACQTKQQFFDLKGDKKKADFLAALEKNMPELREKISIVGKEVAARLGVGEKVETPPPHDGGDDRAEYYDEIPL